MDHWKIFYRYKIHHLLLWGVLFAGWYFFRVDDFPDKNLALKATLVRVITLAVLVYFTNYVLIPKLLYRKKYGLFFSIFLTSIFLLGLVKIYLNNQLLQPYFPKIPLHAFDNFKGRFYDNIIPLFLLVCTGAALRLIQDYLHQQKRMAEIAREKAETELQFLKSQINPHFLFNSLNGIYFLIDKQNAEARQTLLQFSDLLRYQLYDCNSDSIEIEKELTYLNDYVRLQRLRKDHHYDVSLNLEGEMTNFRITPLLLIPFVENAFKHISNYSDRMNFVSIALSRKNNSFHFSIVNSKDNHQSNELQKGIGLANVKRRLELIYPGKHQLQIDNKDDIFTVDLQLNIDNIPQAPTS